MTTISRINATIDNHNLAASIIAFGLLASVSSISAAAINYNGQLAMSTYDDLALTTPAVQTAATSKTSTTAISLGDASTLTFQSQQPNAIGKLQPAQVKTVNDRYTASTLQPSINNVQLTGANPQRPANIQ